MFGWLFSPSPVVYETSPEERFMIVMRRLDAIERAVEELRAAVLGEEVSVPAADARSDHDHDRGDEPEETDHDGSAIEDEPGLEDLEEGDSLEPGGPPPPA